jgi:hypothetical protein
MNSDQRPPSISAEAFGGHRDLRFEPALFRTVLLNLSFNTYLQVAS